MPASTTKQFIPTKTQTSAGGIAYRKRRNKCEVAIVKIVPEMRWQIPKGVIDKGETPEQAAVREVREEAGIETEIVASIEKVEYWYYWGSGDERTRIHKFVHFYLMKYLSGSTDDHDHEVAEARWVSFEDAVKMLSFKDERSVVEKAYKAIKDETNKHA